MDFDKTSHTIVICMRSSAVRGAVTGAVELRRVDLSMCPLIIGFLAFLAVGESECNSKVG